MSQIVCQLSSVHIRSDVRVFYKECLSLTTSGYKVHLIVADGQGNSYNQSVKIHDVGKSPNRMVRMLISPLKVFFTARKTKAALYHFHDPELIPVGLLLQLFTSAPVVYDAHESYPEDIRHKDYLSKPVRVIASFCIARLESFAAKRFASVITVTDYHAKRFAALNHNTTVICNYPLLAEWKTLTDKQICKQPGSLCYIGNITRKRGLTQLLQAIEGLDVTLHLAGGYEPKDYRDELSQLPGWSKVIEYGYINREKAVEIISQSELGVMLFLPEPNHINSLSTKVFEYMAGATCVLISRFPVYQELIDDNACGVTVNPLDVKEIRTAIRDLTGNPKATKAMGQRGRELILNKYNWETQEKALFHLYSNLLTNNQMKDK